MASRLKFLVLPLIAICFIACQTDKAPELKPLNLLSYGVPLTIMAPDSSDVKKDSGFGLIEEVTVTGPGNYGLLIQSSDAGNSGAKDIKEEQLSSVKAKNRNFSRIIEEDETGFLYELKFDSTNVNFQFFKAKVEGSKEYWFTTPYTGRYTEAEAKRVYDSLSEVK